MKESQNPRGYKNGSSTKLSTANERVSSISSFATFENKDMGSILETMQKLLHWAAIIDSSDDAIISKSADGYITSWNPGAERLYGYNPEEVIGQPVSMLMPEEKEDDFPWLMESLRQGKKVDHYITKRKTKDGRVIDVSITVSPIRDTSGQIIGASKIARDITAMLEQERQKDVFISAVSHELKTPITTQSVYGELLEELVRKNGDKKYEKYITKINEQSKKLVKLVNDLLELSRMNATTFEILGEPFSIDDAVKSVAEDMQTLTAKKITTDLAIGRNIIGDRERIAQVLTNLISNAAKYSPEADQVSVRSYIKDSSAIVEVKDYGIGINKEDLQKVFKRFYRATLTNTQSFPGMGIGLSICKEVAKKHGGDIWAESQVGQGSTFYLSLPLDGINTSAQ